MCLNSAVGVSPMIPCPWKSRVLLQSEHVLRGITRAPQQSLSHILKVTSCLKKSRLINWPHITFAGNAIFDKKWSMSCAFPLPQIPHQRDHDRENLKPFYSWNMFSRGIACGTPSTDSALAKERVAMPHKLATYHIRLNVSSSTTWSQCHVLGLRAWRQKGGRVWVDQGGSVASCCFATCVALRASHSFSRNAMHGWRWITSQLCNAKTPWGAQIPRNGTTMWIGSQLNHGTNTFWNRLAAKRTCSTL